MGSVNEQCICWQCDYVCCAVIGNNCETCKEKVKECGAFEKEIVR